MYYQNVRSLKNKAEDFFCSCLSENFNIIVLTETWLSPEFPTSVIFDDRYQVFRNDRNVFNSNKTCGGGVLVAVEKSFNPIELSVIQVPVEHIFVKFSAGVQKYTGLVTRELLLKIIFWPPDVNVKLTFK